MYKIKKIGNSFSHFEIQEGINLDLGYSFEEQERRNIKAKDLGVKEFLQNELPSNLESKYWKVENGVVVDMLQSEIDFVNNSEIYEQKKIDFTRRGNLYQFIVYVVGNGEDALEYVEKNYKQLYKLINNQDSLFKEIDTTTLDAKIFLNEIDGAFAYIVSEDPQMTLEALSDYKP